MDMENYDKLFEEQIQLEMDMMTGGINRFRKATDKAITQGKESNTSHGHSMVARLVDKVAQEVSHFVNNPTNVSRDIAYKYLKHMNHEQVAYLSLVTLIDSISKKNTLMNVARTIGASLEIQDRLDRWIHADGETATNVIKLAMKKAYGARRYGLTHKMNAEGYKDTQWLKSERVHVGFKLVDLIIKSTGVIKVETLQETRKQKTTYVVPTKETTDWIEAYNKFMETTRPRYAPSIIPPKKWTDLRGGGYHGHSIDELPVVRRK